MLCRRFFFASVSSRWCFVLVSLWGGARVCKPLASQRYSRLGFWIGSDAAACVLLHVALCIRAAVCKGHNWSVRDGGPTAHVT